VAGKAKALDGLGGDTRHFMEDPARFRLPDDKVTRPIPKPKVMVSCQAEWEVIVQMLFEAKLIRIIDDSDIPRFDGERLLQGVFGVSKPGKQVEDGCNLLRFIMDCRATNAVLAVLRGDLRSMASATSLMNVVILPTEVAVFSAEDLVAAFYLLGLPEVWHGYFTFERQVDARFVGGTPGRLVRVCAMVLPMGFSGATAVMQNWHRRLASGQLPRSLAAGVAGLPACTELRVDRPNPLSSFAGPRALWSIYLDDFGEMAVFDAFSTWIATRASQGSISLPCVSTTASTTFRGMRRSPWKAKSMLSTSAIFSMAWQRAFASQASERWSYSALGSSS